MRWLAALVVTAAGVALGLAGLFLLRDEDPEELLPDLDQAVPTELAIVQEGDTYRLAFGSAVDNVGQGPLLVTGKRPDASARVMEVRQTVRSSDGSTRERLVDGEIRYVRSEDHAHWHLLDFERYELRSAEDGELVQPDAKTGFCLGDRYETSPETRLENEPDEAVWTEECGRRRPGLLTVSEGISPGYGDDYVPALDGQFLDVTSVPPGRYLLVHRANPDRALEESEYGNNAASVLIQLRRTTGVIPAVRVLARCPDSETCSD
ncbi:MAG: lysyl oxidase family protein [Gaiellaceae bacterium]